MQILKLKLKNLASLEGETELDFTLEPLKSAGIFAITGQTGSGKSTLLDAICLALYGTTSRYNSSGERGQKFQDVSGQELSLGDARRILRAGAAEGYARVTFKGTGGDVFMAEWAVRRARNRQDGNLMKADVMLQNISKNTHVTGTPTEISNRIQEAAGLSFEQFTRVILLSQGEFAAFLKAGINEKADLLEKLTGTEIYSLISRKVFERHRDEESKLHTLKQQKEAIALLSQDEKAEKEQQLSELENEKNVQSRQKEELKSHRHWLGRLEDLDRKIEQEVKNLEAAENRRAQNRDKEYLLQQLDQLEPIRQTALDLLRQEDEISSIEKSLVAEEENRIKLLESLEESRKQKQAAEEEKRNAEKALTDAGPEMEKAIEWDTHISNARISLKNRESRLQNHLAEHLQKQGEKEQIEKMMRNLQNTMTDLDAYFSRHAKRKNLAENAALVDSRLVDAHTFLKKETEAKKLESEARDLLEKTKKTLSEKSEELNTEKENFFVVAGEKEEIKKQLEALNPVQLQSDRNEAQEKSDRLKKDAETFEKIGILEKALKTDRAAAKEKEEALRQCREELQELKPKLDSAEKERLEARNALRTALLATSDNVVEMRHQLQEGADCPVCGSKDHPYRESSTDFISLTRYLENQTQKAEARFESLASRKTTLETQISGAETDLPLLEKRISETEEKSEQHRSGLWKADAGPDQLREELNQTNALLQDLIIQLKKASELQNQWNKKTEQESALKTKCQNSELEITRLDGQIENAAMAIHQHQEAADAAGKAYLEKYSELQEFFENDHWVSGWKENPDDFRGKLKSFAAEWKKNLDEKEQTTKQITKTEGDIRSYSEAINTLDKQILDFQKDLDETQNALDNLLKERKSILNGKTAQEVNLTLNQSVQMAGQKLDMATEKQHGLELKRKQTDTSIGQYIQSLDSNKDHHAKARQKIDNWLDENKEFYWEEMLRVLRISFPEIVEMRRELAQIADDIKNTASILGTYRKDREKHHEERKQAFSADETEFHLTEADKRLEVLEAGIIQIRTDLENHARQTEYSMQLLEKMEEQSSILSGWAQLKTLIGSSDGKVFRQYAQEYTLDVLLAYANVQMGLLNKRYKLERINDNLSLQIADLDMGGELRPVGSLSGGETFLASLALALGLSSLTSANMKVDSLFIDEGFGSLDSQTLSIAMDALERLNNQGKMVGVISHVQEMTERIPVQIRVIKEKNGRSRVELAG